MTIGETLTELSSRAARAGVALAAIQGLEATLRTGLAGKERRIEALQKRIEALEALLAENSVEGPACPQPFRTSTEWQVASAGSLPFVSAALHWHMTIYVRLLHTFSQSAACFSVKDRP